MTKKENELKLNEFMFQEISPYDVSYPLALLSNGIKKELFTNIPSKVKNLVDDVRIGKIGLPDFQRPFGWKKLLTFHNLMITEKTTEEK